MPVTLIGVVWSGPQASATFTTRAAPTVRASATFYSQQPSGRVSASATFSSYAELPDVPPSVAIEYQGSVTGMPGPVLSWDYSHNSGSEELSVRVEGQFGMAMPVASVQAKAKNAVTGDLLGALPMRTFATPGQEPQVNVGENTTEFRFKNSFDMALRGVKLPELIAWKLQPNDDPCQVVRRTQSVSQLVHQVMREAVDPNFTLEDDPLISANWTEFESDYSTQGLTPQAIWDATYGVIGMELQIAYQGSGIKLVGRWPRPMGEAGGPPVPASLTTTLSEHREWLQTPASLTVRGADDVIPLTAGKLLSWVGGHPAYDEIADELLPSSERVVPEAYSGTALTRGGWRKQAGQLVAEMNFTVDDVKTQETVDGKNIEKVFYGVITGYTSTRRVFDSTCPQRILSERTVQQSWAYTPFTQTSTFLVAGPGVFSAPSCGDLSAETHTLTTYHYSPQGHLLHKLTSTTRLGSLEQDWAFEEPLLRKALTARETLKDSTIEDWMPVGGGGWRHTVVENTQALLTVYDKESGDAARTQVVTRSKIVTNEITPQAPPIPACKPCAPTKLRDVHDPVGATIYAGDAGFAEERTVTVPFADKTLVGRLAELIMKQNWGRIRRNFGVAVPLAYPPGTRAAQGMVQSLRISQSEGSETIDTTLETVEFDTLWGLPGGAGDFMLPSQTGKAVMLAGTPSGAIARVVKGWSGGGAITENTSIRFRSGFPPRPGDEIEWQMNNGVREATNARS